MSQEYLHVKNWSRWQSYRHDRGHPPWIKVHRRLMRDPNWVALTDAQKGQLVCIWMLAADHNGRVPSSPKLIKQLCCLESEPDLTMLMSQDFLDAKMPSRRRRHVAPEAETETETEKKEKGGKSEKYEFESGVIRLTKKTFDDWVRTFPNLNLRASLLSLTPWAEQFGGKWFFPVAAALRKRDEEQALKAKQTGFVRHGPNDPMAGII